MGFHAGVLQVQRCEQDLNVPQFALLSFSQSHQCKKLSSANCAPFEGLNQYQSIKTISVNVMCKANGMTGNRSTLFRKSSYVNVDMVSVTKCGYLKCQHCVCGTKRRLRKLKKTIRVPPPPPSLQKFTLL